MKKNKIKVAIADDHAIFRRGIVSLLQNNDDFEVVLQASNGQELIDNLEETRPQVILMDLQMPILDGIRATQQIKANFSHIKIIIISMHDESQFVTHLMELGANGYLLKDADPNEVENAIYTVNNEDYYYGKFLLKVMHNRMVNKPTRKAIPFLSTQIELTDREVEVLQLICEGITAGQIGDKINLSSRTIEGHRNRIMEKTGTKNIAGLVAWAVRNGVV